MLTYFTVSNLSPVTNYTIYVAAKTRKGIGAWVSADIQSGVPPGYLILPNLSSEEMWQHSSHKELRVIIFGLHKVSSVTLCLI